MSSAVRLAASKATDPATGALLASFSAIVTVDGSTVPAKVADGLRRSSRREARPGSGVVDVTDGGVVSSAL